MRTLNEQLTSAIMIPDEPWNKIDKAEEVLDNFAVLFSVFCAENYMFNDTHWTRLGQDYTTEELLIIYKQTK